MEHDVIATHLENLDRRLANVEQILPTLATKEDLLGLATKDETGLLATKDELAAALAPLATKEELKTLATKEELREALREEHAQLRLHMTMLIEHQDSKLQLLAEHVLSQMPKQTEE